VKNPTPQRKMVLSYLMSGAGMHQSSWRLPGSRVEEAFKLSLYSDIAQKAEAAKLHLLFHADSPTHNQSAIATRPLRYLEAVTLATAVAARTSRIGVIATMSTTFGEPYNIARQIASLDHISGGRAGWNFVTSFGGAENFSDQPLPEHAVRHHRADEFLRLVRKLWDSWDDDAVVLDRETGLWADPSKIRPVDFNGEIFKVTGPLNMPRSPQGRPILVQAGASDAGRTMAARHADLVYTTGTTLEEAQTYYRDIKRKTLAEGRQPDDVKVLPGAVPVIGATFAEAEEIHRELSALINFETGRGALQAMMPEVPLKELDLDKPIPEEMLPDPEKLDSFKSRFLVYRDMTVNEGRTLRQLIAHHAMSGGHWVPFGTADQVAEALIDRFNSDAGDGFNLSAQYVPGGFEALADKLVPALQERGYFRTDFEGETLRENLGLRPVPNRSEG